MDDIVKNPLYVQHYTIGPSKAWNAFINANMLEEISHRNYSCGRGESVINIYIIYKFNNL